MTYDEKFDYYRKGVIFRWNAINPYTSIKVFDRRLNDDEIVYITVTFWYKGYSYVIDVTWDLNDAKTYADLNFSELRTVELLGEKMVIAIVEGANKNG